MSANKMQVKRYVAATMSRALQLVRDDLGNDAVILANRRTPEGIEVLAAPDYQPQSQPPPASASAPARPAPPADSAAPAPTGDPFASDRRHPSDRELEAAIQRARSRLQQREAPRATPAADPEQGWYDQLLANAESIHDDGAPLDSAPFGAIPRQAPAANSPQVKRSNRARASAPAEDPFALDDQGLNTAAVAGGPTDDRLASVVAELQQMRTLLHQQLHQQSPSPEPSLKADAATPASPGIDNADRLAQQVARLGIPDNLAQPWLRDVQGQPLASGWRQVLARLAQQLPVTKPDPVAGGGVFALVGPAGHGKTTTLAKLATRYVLKHGADQVALLTTDSYRLGALDQLRALGRILGVPVQAVNDGQSLGRALHQHRKRGLILIDTAGLRFGDPQLKQQLTMLAAHPSVRSLLVLAANSQAQVLKASIHGYRDAGPKACVLTKLDESGGLGEALATAIEHRLPLAYSTDGQEIPEAIAPAKASALVAKAVALLKEQGETALTGSEAR